MISDNGLKKWTKINSIPHQYAIERFSQIPIIFMNFSFSYPLKFSLLSYPFKFSLLRVFFEKNLLILSRSAGVRWREIETFHLR